MTVSTYELMAGPAKQQFTALFREALIEALGDHKWLVKLVNEEKDPESFGTSDEEFARKFLCKSDCVCEGQGDCDPDECECLFEKPKLGVTVQYNIKTGTVSNEEINKIAVTISEDFGFEDPLAQLTVFAVGGELASPELDTAPFIEELASLINAGLTEEELVKRVLVKVRSTLNRSDHGRHEYGDMLLRQGIKEWLQR